MKSTGKLAIFMTCETIEESRAIARALCEQKKAACVGIFPRGESYFWWEGKIDTAREFLLIAKTTEALVEELIAVVKSLHSYEVPEIVALPLVGGSREYMQWLEQSVEERNV